MTAFDSPLRNQHEMLWSGANAAAVTPNDDNDLAVVTRALYIGGAGDVAVVMAGGGTVTFTNVPDGSLLPIRVSRVLATGTTATDLVAVW